MPLSNRTLGDDGLYLYEGYRLATGGDPSAANAEMPPLGKYAIGYALRLFHNASQYGFLMMTLAMIRLFSLSQAVFGSALPALLVTLLAVTDPLLASQFRLTMLDSSQLVLFLAYLLSLCTVIRKPHPAPYHFFLSGLILGLFSACKFAALTPLLVLVTVIPFRRTFRFKDSLIFLAGIGTGYVLPYFGYFIHHHTFLDWLKLQKWMVSFYRHQGVVPNFGSAFTAIMSGRFLNLFSRQWQSADYWSFIWPVITCFSFYLIRNFFREDKSIMYPDSNPDKKTNITDPDDFHRRIVCLNPYPVLDTIFRSLIAAGLYSYRVSPPKTLPGN